MVMELDSMELMVVEQKKLISVLYQFVFFRFYADSNGSIDQSETGILDQWEKSFQNRP